MEEPRSNLSSTREKGDDGHYYECMIGDNYGHLLCCESCPRTYHLECLKPPLKAARERVFKSLQDKPLLED